MLGSAVSGFHVNPLTTVLLHRLDYNVSLPKIPAVSITVEDAELFWRLTQRGIISSHL